MWMLTDLSTEMEIAEENGGLRAGHNEDDEDEKQKSKHVVHLMWPERVHNQSTRHRAIANILHSRYVARMPPLEARSPGCRSNVENTPRRRPVTGQPAMPTCDIQRAILRTTPSPADQ